MKQFKLLIWLALFLQQDWLPLCTALQQQTSPKTQSSVVQLYDRNREAAPASESILGSMYRKSRKLRCVRCYEDRYGDDRSRYYGSAGAGGAVGGSGGGSSGYASRTADNWYYPHERYEDRYRPDDRYRADERYGANERYGTNDRYRTEDRYRPEYDRYSAAYSAAPSYYRDRDERLGSRTYDRYEGRGYDRYDRRGGAYAQDPYADYYRDRGYERPRGGGGGYDRDYYDRSSSARYDYRNYRPWDETYRGQSGFDNSGRGYYFADDDNERHRYPPKSAYDQRDPIPPCGIQVRDCPYAGNAGGGGGRVGDTTRVSSGPLNSQHGYNYGAGYGYGVGSSGGYIGNGGSSAGAATHNTSANNSNTNTNSNNSQGWSYANERDRESSLMQGNNGASGDRGRGRERERGREQQSSSYGGRAPRPLGGSYLFDRNSNTVGDDKVTDMAADKDGNSGNADGANNLSAPGNGAQNGDRNNGHDNAGSGANSVQTIVRD